MKKLLIVEDNPANMKVLKYLTRDLGYQVTYCFNASEALEYLSQNSPDVVLCDIQMPDMDGVALLERIRGNKASRNAHVIAVTAHTMSGDKERLLKLGFDDYMSKPIDTRQLRNLLLQLKRETSNPLQE